MIRKKSIYILLLGTGLFFSSGCNQFLEVEPQDGLIQQEFWKTKEHVQSAVIGAYISLTENSVVNNLFRWGELRGDMLALAQSPSNYTVDEQQMMQGSILPTNALANWANIYLVINNCNLIIDKAPQAQKTDPTFTNEIMNARIAEAKAIRALMYFYLVRTFKEVPLQLEGVSSDQQVYSLPKSTSDQILDQIEKDLEFAAQHADFEYGSLASTKGRITRYAVFAMQADVFLWRDKYAEANAACDKIINSNKFILIPGLAGFMFEELYSKGNSLESVFEFQYTTEKPNLFYNAFGGSPRAFLANAETVDGLFEKDPNAPDLQDLRASYVAYDPNDYTIYKYIYTGAGFRSAAESTAHYIIYRYADVLLMKAEALAYLNEGTQSLQLIDSVRTRAKALNVTHDHPDVNSPSALEDFILEERAREFAFEGKRWFDLLRIAKRNNYAKLRTLTEAASLNVPPATQQSYKTKLQDPNSHYLPVPLRDLQSNKNLVQNPFYK